MESATASHSIEVLNPATGEPVGEVPDSSAEAVKALAERARKAQVAWDRLGFEGRAEVFHRAQKWMFDNADRVVETIVSETGKTYEDALNVEVLYTGKAFGFWAKHAPEYLADEQIRSWAPLALGKKLIVRYKPLGLVGVIGPWNFPLSNSFGDCIPALAAGNSVILKPSEETPLSSLLMEEMMLECGCPQGVFQVATGRGQAGAALIDEVDFVMFTGSTETGKKVMKRAAETLTPVSLELGGKDPMLVLADANIDRAASTAVTCSMNNGGQVCISVERAYVEEPVYDQFVAKVVERARKLRIGSSQQPGVAEVGAIIFPPQLETIEEHVKDAVEKGAKVLVGGKRSERPGQFYEPTVLVDVDHSMKCMQEETFGPLLPIMKVKNEKEAIRLANDSPYGLQASVWTHDTKRGEAVARQIESGVCCVNDAQVNYTVMELPMGGWKASGLGSRHGAGGIRKYCAQQSLMVNSFAPKGEPHLFPFKAWRTKLLFRATKLLYGRPGRRE